MYNNHLSFYTILISYDLLSYKVIIDIFLLQLGVSRRRTKQHLHYLFTANYGLWIIYAQHITVVLYHTASLLTGFVCHNARPNVNKACNLMQTIHCIQGAFTACNKPSTDAIVAFASTTDNARDALHKRHMWQNGILGVQFWNWYPGRKGITLISALKIYFDLSWTNIYI